MLVNYTNDKFIMFVILLTK